MALPLTVPSDETVNRIQHDLDALAGLSLDDLRLRYRKLTRKTAVPGLARWLLLRIIAWHLQVEAFGGYDAQTRAYLDQVSKAIETERRSREKAIRSGKTVPKRTTVILPSLVPQPRHRPGTQYVREHDGQMHRVTVLAEGFECDGKVWRSLSEIARAITGTNWNGPAFFGLRPPKAKRGKRPPTSIVGVAEDVA